MEETQGQVTESAEPAGTTAATTGAASKGQSTATAQTTSIGTESVVESFFDPESIKGKPELEAAYKEMQRAFSKKTSDLAKGRDKIRQYDEFIRSPVDSMRKLAQQMGYQLVQGQAESKDGKPKTYETWDEVMQDAEARVLEKLKPVIGEIQSLKKQNIESYLDNNFSDWRTYEDEMMANLEKHPTLVTNPDELYRLSVPESVHEARLMKKLQAKMKGAAEGNQIQGQSATNKQASQRPKKGLSFSEAVQFAKSALASKGITAPREV